INPGRSVIDPRSWVTAPAAGATLSIFDPRTVTTSCRCTRPRPSKPCAARIDIGALACGIATLAAPASRISAQALRTSGMAHLLLMETRILDRSAAAYIELWPCGSAFEFELEMLFHGAVSARSDPRGSNTVERPPSAVAHIEL